MKRPYILLLALLFPCFLGAQTSQEEDKAPSAQQTSVQDKQKISATNERKATVSDKQQTPALEERKASVQDKQKISATNERKAKVSNEQQATALDAKKAAALDAQQATVLDEPLPLAADSTQFSLPAPIPAAGSLMPFRMCGISPFGYGPYAAWDLHKGFNASFGMSVSTAFGKHAPSGVGFGQDAAFLYAVPLNSRLSVAGGLYATNMNWGRYSYRNVGITGIAAFKVNERITLYGYGSKSILPDKRQGPLYPLPNFSPDKFGGMIHFKLSESSYISVSVEGRKNDWPYAYYW